ncbi:Hint domain-containing protein [Aliiroseovarius crassostreae]|uniref:Hint domain-containing protein n=1 Tax=Aliiroseovarius crassostreae TaxID=154981 RepID=UPI003C7DC6A8
MATNTTSSSGNDTLIGDHENDSIDAQGGDDLVVAGGGDDTVEGGAGQDTLYGDHLTDAARAFLDWSLLGSDGTDLTGGFTQDTGDVDVSVSFTDPGNNNTTFAVETSNTQYTGSGPFDANSAGRLFGDGDADTAVLTVDFAASAGSSASGEVENVAFRINDLDRVDGNHIDEIVVTAYDADGNPVTVNLTAGSDMGLSGDTATGQGNYTTASEEASLLVEIPGPVSKIVISYANRDATTHAVDITDIYFDPIKETGDDSLSGGAGNDSLYGGEGLDTLEGGTGADYLEGGAAQDTADYSASSAAVTVDLSSGTGSGGDAEGDMLTGVDGIIGSDHDDTLLGYDGQSLTGDLATDYTNIFDGGAGDDYIDGRGGDDILRGGADDDTLVAGAGDDQLFGDGGDDVFDVDAGFGSDTIVGGETGETAGDTLDASSMSDNIALDLSANGASDPESGTLSAGGDTLTFSEIENVHLGSGDDTATGSSGDDNVDLGAGNDSAQGGAGNDTLEGGDGADTLLGQQGDDSLSGGDGNDTMGVYVAPVMPELIANGSFEDGTHSANGVDGLNNWFNIAGSPDSADDGTSAESWNPSHAGSDGTGYITMWSDTNAPNETMGQTLGAPLEEGKTYSFTFDAYSSDYVNGQWFTAVDKPVNFEILDQDGNVLGTAVVQGTSYEEYEIQFVAPAGVTGIQLRPNQSPDATMTYPSVVLDDVSLTEVPEVPTGIGAGNDTMDGGAGDDLIHGGDGNDSLLGGTGADTIDGGADADTIVGGSGADDLSGGAGDDDISVGGADTASGGTGDDVFTLDTTDLSGDVTAIIDGGSDGTDGHPDGPENGDEGDVLDLSAAPGGVDITFTADPEDGTVDGLDGDASPDITFEEIEKVIATGQDDVIDGSATTSGIDVVAGDGQDAITGGTGTDTIDAGAGADTVDAGGGNDVIDLGQDPNNPGTPDGDVDRLVFEDGDGQDVIHNFDGPVLDSNGNPTQPNDLLDVSGLTDAGGDPVDTMDVTVTTNPDGDPVLTFPNGESVTLVDVPAGPFTDPLTVHDALVAIGIPRGTDGYVDGSSGDDLIDGSYTGDPTDDMVDAGDAVLPGMVGDDDHIRAGAGDDTIAPGAGDDIVEAGDGDDRIELQNGFGNDTITGGEGAEDEGGDLLDASDVTDDLTLDLSGADPESGTLTDGTDTVTFSEIESVTLGSGDDTATGSDGNDSIFAGAGDDSLSGGDGADTLFGNEGSDTVDGGGGDDLINTRTSPGTGAPDVGIVYPDDPSTPQDESALFSYPADSDPNNDRDSVDGGSGNDTILTGDDDDTILGGSGNDLVDAGFDDDSVDGGLGDDTLQGQEGNDTIEGGDGHDVIYGGLSPTSPDYAAMGIYSLEDDGANTLTDPEPDNNSDSLSGRAGNDSIYGGDDNDTLSGGADDDLLDGGIDDDRLDGGAGDDQLIGGHGDDTMILSTGADTVSGGDGQDSYRADGPLDEQINVTVADDGAGTVAKTDDATTDTLTGVEHFVADETARDDTITLTTTVTDRATIEGLDPGVTGVFSPTSGAPDVTFGGPGEPTLADLLGNPNLSGTVTITGGDESGKIGNISFENFEVINFDIVCFARGTMILTAEGEVPVEDLTPDMRVVTLDRGFQRLRWVGSRIVKAHGKFAPVRIKAGHFGLERDLWVSQQHRLLLKTPMAELMFGESQVLAPAKGLVNDDSVRIVEGGEVEYFHLMFDGHELVYSNGIPTESFHPAQVGMGSFADETRREIFDLFPELEMELESYGRVARPSLSVRETRALQGRLM